MFIMYAFITLFPYSVDPKVMQLSNNKDEKSFIATSSILPCGITLS